MAAASFLVPSLTSLSRPNRIRHSVRVNIRRRERITPPPHSANNRFGFAPPQNDLSRPEIKIGQDHILTELEELQEKHIRHQMRFCFRPFRLFLSAIGRFPYKVVKDESDRSNRKIRNRKESNFPLLNGFVSQVFRKQEEDPEKFDDEMMTTSNSKRHFEYDPCSVRSLFFTVSSIIVLITLVLSLLGYADLCLTLFEYEKLEDNRSSFKLLDSWKAPPITRDLSITKKTVLNCAVVVWQKNKDPLELATSLLNFSESDYEQLMLKHKNDVIRCQTAKDLKQIVDDNLIFLIVILACTLNTVFQSTVPLFHGLKSANFLTNWSERLAKTRFDVTHGIRKRVIFELTFLSIFATVFICLYFAPSEIFSNSETHFVQDAVRAASLAIYRPFVTDPRSCASYLAQPKLSQSANDSWIESLLHQEIRGNCLPISKYIQELPIFLLALLVAASYKGYVFFYVCVCRSLTNGFKEWNKKATHIFEYKGTQLSRIDFSLDGSSPCTLDHLVESHFILLDLVGETNEIFGIIIGSYFATQVIILCFESYFLVEMGLSGGWITICAFGILLQTMLIVILVALSASYVHEEATNGFEALRGAYRNYLSSDEERMLQTLLTSFSGPPIMLTGGKFFGLHRPFLLTVVGVIITYFVVILQMIKYG